MALKPVFWWTFSAIAFVCLAALFAYKIWGGISYDRNIAAQSDLTAIVTQLKFYKEQNGSYPSTRQGLHALVVRPDSSPIPHDWIQHFREDIVDPWHHSYMYRYPSARDPRTFDLFSLGPDGVESSDDIWLPR